MAETARDFGTAEAAVRLAPDDPTSHIALARLHRVSFLPESVPVSLAEYERAARLAPNDFLVWLELGRARGSAGDAEGGAAATRRAVELAPAYAQPRWHLGNLLLRAGRVEEAFAELRLAADADPALRPQVFNLAWQVYGQDMAAVTRAVGDSPQARAQLVTVLLGRTRLDEALALWSGLPAGEKRAQQEAGGALAHALFEKKRYRDAMRLANELSAEGARLLEPGKVYNGGFESNIPPPGQSPFDWQVASVPQAQIALDPRTRRGGERSLRISFNVSGALDFKNVLQLVVVEPGARYRLSFYVRAEDLRSVSTPLVEVLDPSDPTRALVASAPLPAGSSEWQQATLEFTAPAGSEAVMVRVGRSACAEACPIFGKVWYDDFDLQRAGNGAAR
jgi:tetratricopeptide (TPR) repeat protein